MLKTNKIEQKQKMKCPFPIVQFTKGSSLKTQHIIRSIKKKREKSPFTHCTSIQCSYVKWSLVRKDQCDKTLGHEFIFKIKKAD